jgi:ribonuclease Y
LNQRFNILREREGELKRLRGSVAERERKIAEYEQQSVSLRQELRERLEKVSGSTIQELKDQLIESMIIEGKRDAQFVIARAEEETLRTAESKANEIVVSSTQSLPLSQIIEHSPTSLETPTQQMIEHLLSREGRFIRILESLLDVELSVEDSEDGLVLSSPDPINREIARATLDRLFREGRLNPRKISEMVGKVRRDISATMHQEALSVLRDLDMKNFREEMVDALGRLLYRYSYGQNNLYHSKEVAILAAKLAENLGCDPDIAKRGGLLHDIGKGFALDGKAHVEMGLELVQKWGEDPRVLNAIASHHDDTEQNCMEAVIVQIADAISGSRPGARRETISNYLERVENLERIAEEFEGVDKAFAIYAGRELRVLANSEEVDDETAGSLAYGIAKKIEESLKYPGKIKVTVIREMKISSFTH